MSRVHNRFKRALLFISSIFGTTLLISGVLLLFQIDTILGGDVESDDELPRFAEEQRVIDELPESIGYTLRRNPTDYQLELFEILAYAHDQFETTGSNSDLKNYASAIVRNFVADFFTFSNKNSRSDVGGLQFFSDDIVDDFRNAAIDGFYLYLNQYIEIFGRESLPTVSSTTILNIEFDTRIIEAEDENSENVDENLGLVGENPIVMEENGPFGEEVRVIIIDVEWSYAPSTLWHINEFQTSARFVLIENEDGVKIYVIEAIEEETERYDFHNDMSS